MNLNAHRSSALATVSLALLFVLAFTIGTRLVAAVDCVGKPYGYPGCPTRPTTDTGSSSSRSGYCGNAIVDEGEQCDKGRFNGKTDCSLECMVLYCGDGVTSKDIGEECEPKTEEYYVQDSKGNLTTEVRFVESECGWYCQPPACDDAGTCAGGCKLKYIGQCAESSSSSVKSLSTSASTSSSSGESHAAAAAESSSGAVSSSSTLASSSSSDSGTDASSSPDAAKCGDSAVQKGEECDDGNSEDADGCSNACELPRCGDGIVHKREECDSAKQNSDATPNACRTNCTSARCGDNVVDKNEQCDTGGRNSDTQTNACRTGCKAPGCGDGVVDRGEQCDAGTQNSDTSANACRKSCRIASCGDGVVDANEACDDGNRSDLDACTNACKPPACGDGVVQQSEQCDWGAKNSDTEANACRSTCKQPLCGDSVVDEGETCDGGKDCEKDCTKKAPVAAVARSSSIRRSPVAMSHAAADSGLADTMLPAVLGASGVAIIFSAMFFRRRIVSIFSRKGARSIDDIPLDQIEMPWHRW